MVISLHGKDLSYYMKNFKKFSLKTVLLIADQLLDIIKQIHQRNIIHRDLKPENIVVGLKDPHKIYLVDFGISKIFKDTNNKHMLSLVIY